MRSVAESLAKSIQVTVSQVQAAIRLLDDGATVPFIARYRKEATGNLNDTQLRALVSRLSYLRELEERRAFVLQAIEEQGKLSPELKTRVLEADSKTRLEDLYLPYRPKRKTKAEEARGRGLAPLAEALLTDRLTSPEDLATTYVNPEAEVPDIATALEGARQILMEKFSEEAELIHELREYLWQHAVLKSVAASPKKLEKRNKKNAPDKYSNFHNYQSPIKTIPSHRALALFRGRRESELQLSLLLVDKPEFGEQRLAEFFNIPTTINPCSEWLKETIHQTWKTKLFPKLELELFARLREASDEDAIDVFARNLQDLLLAAPAGRRVTLGLDPGLRTGVKVAVVDETGKVLDYSTIYPFSSQNEREAALAELARLVIRHQVSLIAIGNGTGSRETERLVADVMKRYTDLSLIKVLVSEAGASVYSASELASLELADLDVSIRGAVSIARRLQDPLAELVKIDPKAIGVGQYQHDVNQNRLARSLDGVVEDCVNAVGVDLNTASVALLMRISGLNETLAKNLVHYRDEHGAFKNRNQLKSVPRMGDKTFQQAAGFLRIMDGEDPLDATAVHPETYALVEKIIKAKALGLKELLGNTAVLSSIKPEDFVDGDVGIPTVRDVLKELEKPGRDPRPEFKTATFQEGIEDISHLHEGMILEGVVSNVTNFGAFVDIGVHQQGLVHVSAMRKNFITDPHAVVKAGDIVAVRVIEVDKERQRIGLSMCLEEKKAPTPARAKPAAKALPKQQAKAKPAAKKPEPVKKTIFNTAMADALSKLKRSS